MSLKAAVSGADVKAGKLTVGLSYAPENRSVCLQPGTGVAALKNLSVSTTGQASAPTTLAGFFPDSLDQVIVESPTGNDAGDAEIQQAVLNAVTAMGHRFPSAAISVAAASAAAAAAPSTTRIIRVAKADNPTVSTVSTEGKVPLLTITGSGAELSSAAAALGQQGTAVATGSSSTGLTAALPTTGQLENSLADLGAQTLKLSGYGQNSSYIGASQSQFGGPISGATVHLEGTHTAVPVGARADLSVYWNDYLISSQTLDGGHTFTVDGTLPRGQIKSENGLRLQLTALPAGGDCTSTSGMLPMEVSVDTAESHISATRGDSAAPGFERFPQALGGSIDVAMDSGSTPSANLGNAAVIVAALAQKSAGQLSVTVRSMQDFTTSGHSGLVVGATPETAQTLSAPLRLAEFRTINSTDVDFGVGTTAPYAALEAFSQGHREVLLLGSWAPQGSSPDAAGLQTALTAYIAEQKDGWSALSRNLLVSQPSGTPKLLQSNALVPQPEVANDFRGYVWWAVGVVAILLLAGALRLWWARRQRAQIRSYVDAQEKAAQHVDAPEHTTD